MAQETTVTCDGCEKPIEEGQKHAVVTVFEMDTGEGITSQPRQNDYHEECLPEEVASAVGFEWGDIDIIESPGPGPEPETPGE